MVKLSLAESAALIIALVAPYAATHAQRSDDPGGYARILREEAAKEPDAAWRRYMIASANFIECMGRSANADREPNCGPIPEPPAMPRVTAQAPTATPAPRAQGSKPNPSKATQPPRTVVNVPPPPMPSFERRTATSPTVVAPHVAACGTGPGVPNQTVIVGGNRISTPSTRPRSEPCDNGYQGDTSRGNGAGVPSQTRVITDNEIPVIGGISVSWSRLDAPPSGRYTLHGGAPSRAFTLIAHVANDNEFEVSVGITAYLLCSDGKLLTARLGGTFRYFSEGEAKGFTPGCDDLSVPEFKKLSWSATRKGYRQ